MTLAELVIGTGRNVIEHRSFGGSGTRKMQVGRVAGMRLTEFHQLVVDEFGDAKGNWISHSHVLAKLGDTPNALIDSGVDPRHVWEELCDDFDVPEERRLGIDYPGK